MVNKQDTPARFFLDERRDNGGVRLTDTFFKLVQKPAALDLASETEARWRLVETAWSMNIGSR